MDPTRDPRRPDYNPDWGAKRRRRSPSDDRPTPRKAPKIGPAEDRSTPSSDSRRSSITAGNPPRQSGKFAAAPNDQRRSSLLSHNDEVTRASNGVSVYSPDSPSSRRSNIDEMVSNDTSRRSTPKPNAAAAVQTRDNTAKHQIVQSSSPITNLLQEFALNVANIAALKMSTEQARARLERAQLEHDKMQPRFQEFPVIKEQKLSATNAARDEFARMEQRLQNDYETQKRLAERIGDLVGDAQNPEVKPNAQTDTEYVSRDKFAELEARYTTLETELAETKKEIMACRARVSWTESIANGADKLARRVEEHDIPHLRGQLSKYQSLNDRSSNVLQKILPTVNVPGWASDDKEKLDKLWSDGESVVVDIQKLKRKIDLLSTNIFGEESPTIPTDLKNCLTKRVYDIEGLQRKAMTMGVKDIGPRLDSHEATVLEGLNDQILDIKTRLSAAEAQLVKLDQAALLERDEELLNDFNNSQVEFNNCFKELRKDFESRFDQLSSSHERLSSTVENIRIVTEDVNANVLSLEVSKAKRSDVDESVRALKKDVEDLRSSMISTMAAAKVPQVEIKLSEVQDRAANVEWKLEQLSQQGSKLVEDMSKHDYQIVAQGVRLDKQEEQLRKMGDQQAKEAAPVTAKAFGSHPSANQPAHVINETVGSPIANGAQPSGGSHPQGPVRISSLSENAPISVSLAQRIAALEQSDDRHTNVTKHLQLRYDNLTTDQVAKQMVDQFSAMYPQAKDFDAAVQRLKESLMTLKAEKDSAVKDLNEEIGRVKNKLEHTAKFTEGVRDQASSAMEIAIETKTKAQTLEEIVVAVTSSRP